MAPVPTFLTKLACSEPPSDFMHADEIFSTGNNSKVVAIKRIESRELQPGPVMLRARKLYWDWAHSMGQPSMRGPMLHELPLTEAVP